MHTVTTIGLDIAKSVFQVHGIDAQGKVVIRRQLRRAGPWPDVPSWTSRSYTSTTLSPMPTTRFPRRPRLEGPERGWACR